MQSSLIPALLGLSLASSTETVAIRNYESAGTIPSDPLGAMKKGHLLHQGCVLPLGKFQPCIISQFQELCARPFPMLLAPWGPFSITELHIGIHAFLVCCCQALSPGFPPGQSLDPCEDTQLLDFPMDSEGNSSSQFIPRIWRTNSPFVPVDYSFQRALLMSSRRKTMCIHHVTCTTLTKVSNSAVAAIMCHTQMPTGTHRLEINLAFMTL